jgi:hypothetical protein
MCVHFVNRLLHRFGVYSAMGCLFSCVNSSDIEPVCNTSTLFRDANVHILNCMVHVWRTMVPRPDRTKVATWVCELRVLYRGPRVTKANMTFTVNVSIMKMFSLCSVIKNAQNRISAPPIRLRDVVLN